MVFFMTNVVELIFVLRIVFSCKTILEDIFEEGNHSSIICCRILCILLDEIEKC